MDSLLGFFPLASGGYWLLGVVLGYSSVIHPPLLDSGRCYPGVLSGTCRLALLGLQCLWVPRSCGVNGLRDGATCLRSGLWSSSVHDRYEAFPSFRWVWFLSFVRGSLPQAGDVFLRNALVQEAVPPSHRLVLLLRTGFPFSGPGL